MPISRSLILQHLRILNVENDRELNRNSPPICEWVAVEPNEADDYGIKCPDTSLEEMQNWLTTQSKIEQARADWTPGNEPFREDTHLRTLSLDTAVLDRIRQGEGPREPTFDDLLAPLRQTVVEDFKRDESTSTEETYEEMKEVLLNWNRQVANVPEDTKARNALEDAMHGRIAFLETAFTRRLSADAHEDSSRKLLHTIHVYRPETASFQTQDLNNLLTIILAHSGFADPDVDDNLKQLMIRVLLTERGYMAEIANARYIRKFEEDIIKAKRRGLVEEVAKLELKYTTWKSDLFARNAKVIINKIRGTRRAIECKQLMDVQELNILHAAQKLALLETTAKQDPSERYHMLKSAWLTDAQHACDRADAQLQAAASQRLSDLDAYSDGAAYEIEAMEDINNARVLTRARKFAGRDLKDVTATERDRIVQKRMSHPATTTMMSDAVADMTEIKNKAKDVFNQVSSIEGQLEDMLDAAIVSYKAYGGMAGLLAEDEAGVSEDRGAEGSRQAAQGGSHHLRSSVSGRRGK
jgi:hypothetical protein